MIVDYDFHIVFLPGFPFHKLLIGGTHLRKYVLYSRNILLQAQEFHNVFMELDKSLKDQSLKQLFVFGLVGKDSLEFLLYE